MNTKHQTQAYKKNTKHQIQAFKKNTKHQIQAYKKNTKHQIQAYKKNTSIDILNTSTSFVIHEADCYIHIDEGFAHE